MKKRYNILTFYFSIAIMCCQSIAYADDRQVLNELRTATTMNGAWTNSTHWGTTEPLNLWYGIQIDENGFVTSINLTNNNLKGSIPASLWNLSKLRFLYLGNNQLEGSIPDNLCNLSQLVVMYLAQNQLSGTIPTTINCLSNMTELWLGNNMLTGGIGNIATLSGLHYLELGSNPNLGVGGSPAYDLSALTTLTNIKSITMTNCGFSCAVPNLSGKSWLINCYLAKNNLTISSPNTFASLFTNLSSLAKLGLHENPNLNCPLEAFIQLNNLQELSLNNCSFSGNIPDLNLPKLKKIWLNRNTFNLMSTNFSTSPDLEFLALSWNQLPSVPDLALNKLEFLYLHQNRLTNFPNLNLSTQLKELYMHNNLLQTSIPSFNFVNLTTLWLQNNQLIGCIPSGLRDNCPNITSGNISNNPTLLTQDWSAYYTYSNPIGHCAALPIELTKFEAHRIGQNVELTWQTTSEKNNDYFDIERSNDGLFFSKIGQIKGNGTTNQFQNYNYLDTKLFSGIHYYRLRQVDVDRKSELSKVVSIEILQSGRTINVFPNPVNEDLTIHFGKQVADNQGIALQVEVYNLQGQLVKIQPLETGFDETQISMRELPAGVYMISLRQNGQISASAKVTKY